MDVRLARPTCLATLLENPNALTFLRRVSTHEAEASLALDGTDGSGADEGGPVLLATGSEALLPLEAGPETTPFEANRELSGLAGDPGTPLPC